MKERSDRHKKSAILAEIPRLRRYARALLREPEAADDLVQDCLERALTRLDSWRDGHTPQRWLFTIMHHLFVDHTRRLKRQRAMLDRVGHGWQEDFAPPTQLDAIASRQILDALQRIDAERRAALLLVSVEGLSYAEAAAVLDIPAGTLMSRVARGREELRGLLDGADRPRAIRIVGP